MRKGLKRVGVLALSMLALAGPHCSKQRPTVALMDFDFGTSVWWAERGTSARASLTLSSTVCWKTAATGSSNEPLDAILAAELLEQQPRRSSSRRRKIGKALGVKYCRRFHHEVRHRENDKKSRWRMWARQVRPRILR